MNNLKHRPVLADEILNLVPNEGKLLVDFTLGMSGHSNKILDSYKHYKILGFDGDYSAIEYVNKTFSNERLKASHADFINAITFLINNKIVVDFVLVDLGVSSYQLNDYKRGFSFDKDGPLDMRMDKNNKMTAATFLNNARENEIFKVLKEYGEEPAAKVLARKIVKQRKIEKFSTTKQLKELVYSTKRKSSRKHNPATLVFQALRIKVNDELNQLQYLLDNILKITKKNSVLAFITFNSLEDRKIKHKIQFWKKNCICPQLSPICNCKGKAIARSINGNFIKPKIEEIKQNSRSRSAKLRAVEIL